MNNNGLHLNDEGTSVLGEHLAKTLNEDDDWTDFHSRFLNRICHRGYTSFFSLITVGQLMVILLVLLDPMKSMAYHNLLICYIVIVVGVTILDLLLSVYLMMVSIRRYHKATGEWVWPWNTGMTL